MDSGLEFAASGASVDGGLKLAWNADQLVADLAYTIWISSAFRNGLPQDAFWAAVRMVKGNSAASQFTMPAPVPPGVDLFPLD